MQPLKPYYEGSDSPTWGDFISHQPFYSAFWLTLRWNFWAVIQPNSTDLQIRLTLLTKFIIYTELVKISWIGIYLKLPLPLLNKFFTLHHDRRNATIKTIL